MRARMITSDGMHITVAHNAPFSAKMQLLITFSRTVDEMIAAATLTSADSTELRIELYNRGGRSLSAPS